MRYLLFTLILLTGNFFISETALCNNLLPEGNRIAISLESESAILTADQIALLTKSGIHLIELSQPEQASFFTDDFYFIAGSGTLFLLPGANRGSVTEIAADAVNKIRQFRAQTGERLLAFSLFHYPYDADPFFFRHAEVIADSVRFYENIPLFYNSYHTALPEHNHSFDFISLRYSSVSPSESLSHSVYHFDPVSDLSADLTTLELLLNRLSANDRSLVVLPAEWLFEVLEKLPDLHYLFALHSKGEVIEMLLPKPEKELKSTMDITLMMAVFLWAVLLLLFRYRPLFVELFSRYFFNHSFMQSDLTESRLRNKSESVLMLLLHLLIGGFFSYTIVTLYFSDTGIEVLAYYLPFMMSPDYMMVLFFLFGILFTFVMHTLSLFWLFLLNRELRKVPVLLNTYAWPFLLNLFPFTLLVFLTQTGGSDYLSLFGLFFFFLLFPAAHSVAAYQGAKQLENYKILNFFITAFLFCGIYFALLFHLLTTEIISDPVRLALWLS